MNTDGLIRELARQGAPVRRASPPSVRFSRWAFVAAGFVAAGVAALGPRPDLGLASRGAAPVLQTLVLLLLAAVSTMAAFSLSVPDCPSRRPALVPLAALAAWSALIAWRLGDGAGATVGPGLKCVRNILALGLPPALLLQWMLRRAAPLRTGIMGLLASLGVAALADAGTCFVCRQDGALHVLAWHYLPVLALAAAGWLAGHLAEGWRD